MSLSSCVAQAVLKKNTEKSIMVLGGKYPTGNSLINSQKPIFPRSIARLSHSTVHETKKVLDAVIEAVEVQTMKTRYRVIETGGFCSCHAYGGRFCIDSLITTLISVAYLSSNNQYESLLEQSRQPEYSI